MIDELEFRRVLGHFASGVTVVTANAKSGSPCGMTVTAFCSLSLEPPLVLVCIENGVETHGRIIETGTFGVSILPAGEGESLSRRFADADLPDRFEGVGYKTVAESVPVLDRSIAWLACRLTDRAAGGDHTIFMGEVIEADAVDGRPLVYFRGGYGSFEP